MRKLSPKQKQIVSLLSTGLRNAEIARELGTTEQVVKNYLREAYLRTGTRRAGRGNRVELAIANLNGEVA